MATEPAQADLEALAKVADDPVLFGEIFLGATFTPDQKRVMQAVQDHDRVAVHSGHAVGKTYLAAALVMWFLHSRRPAKVITTAPTWTQVDEVLWSEIRMAHERSVVDLGSEMPPRAPEMRVDGEHFAIGISTDQPARMQGYHSPNQMIIIDEAAGVEQKIWDGVEFIASGGKVKILCIGNPESPDGPFFEACCGGSGLWHSINLSCLDHPNITGEGDPIPGAVTPDWIEGRELEWGVGSPLFQARVQGLFPEEGTDTLISLKWVTEATGKSFKAEWTPTVIACDVARFGEDETVLVVLKNQAVLKLDAWKGRDLMETVGRIQKLKTELELGEVAAVVIDDCGLGGGVTDRLRELGHNVLPFNGGSKARDEKDFLNKRAEAWWGLREAFREGQIGVPDDAMLKSQLTSIKYKPRSDGRVELEKKDDMLKRGVKSPDRGDALVMAWWGRGQLWAARALATSPRSSNSRDKPRRSGGRAKDLFGGPGGKWQM